MTSLITPIYINGEFFGIIGHDVILDDLYAEILNKQYYNTGYGYIFNAKRNIVIHPHHLDKLLETANMGEKLSFNLLDEKGLIMAMSEVINLQDSGKRLFSKEFYEDDKEYYFHSYKLDFLDWYFALVIPKEEVTGMLPEFRNKFLLGVFITGSIMFLWVVFLVWIYIVSPVKKSINGCQNNRNRRFYHTVSYKSGDEVGVLVNSINTMTKNLKEITASRDQLNKEITVRKEVENELKKHRDHLEDLIE